MELTHNAEEVAGRLEEAAGRLGDLEGANADAGALALTAIDQETPRRTGTLAAGGRVVATALGFAYVNATPYAVIVDAKTGFATDTLREREAAIAGVYDNHVEEALASLT